MTDKAQARKGAGERVNGGGGVVARAVIDIDDLVIERAVERGADLRHQRRDVRRLVAHGNDDGQVHAGWRVAQFPGSDKRQIGAATDRRWFLAMPFLAMICSNSKLRRRR